MVDVPQQKQQLLGVDEEFTKCLLKLDAVSTKGVKGRTMRKAEVQRINMLCKEVDSKRKELLHL